MISHLSRLICSPNLKNFISQFKNYWYIMATVNNHKQSHILFVHKSCILNLGKVYQSSLESHNETLVSTLHGSIRMAPSRRITSPFIMGFSAIVWHRWANSAGSPRRGGKGTNWASVFCTFSGRPIRSGVENRPATYMCSIQLETGLQHSMCSIQLETGLQHSMCSIQLETGLQHTCVAYS